MLQLRKLQNIHHFIAPTPHIISTIHSVLPYLIIGTTKEKKITIIQQNNIFKKNFQSYGLDNSSLLLHYPTTPFHLFLPLSFQAKVPQTQLHLQPFTSKIKSTLHYTQTTNNPPPSHAFIKSLW
jgi:hypothetical protein